MDMMKYDLQTGRTEKRNGNNAHAIILIILLLSLLLTGCGKKTPEPIPTVIPYTPEPTFDRDAAVFGDDVKMTDLSEYAEDCRAVGIKVSQGVPDLDMADMNKLRDILQGKNVRLITLRDVLKVRNIGKIELGRFGLQTQSLNDNAAGELAEMENCRALVYYDTDNQPLSENIVWPYLRSLTIKASQLSKWEKPVSEIFPALRELIVSYDMIETLDLASSGLPETLESLEIIGTKDSIHEVPALYTAQTAKNIPSVQFINGRAAGGFDPVISDQKKAEYERNLYLAGIINTVNEALMKNRGKIVRQENPGLSELRIPEGAKIMCIHKDDLSSCSYNGDNEKIRTAITDDPKECDILFIESSESHADPNVRVVSATGSSSGGRIVKSLAAIDIASGNIYSDTIYSYGFIGVQTDQQKKNKLFEDKGLWGFIEPLF